PPALVSGGTDTPTIVAANPVGGANVPTGTDGTDDATVGQPSAKRPVPPLPRPHRPFRKPR
ncbi:MAG: hypothetical protein K2V38_14770, partial [Gemmataceae bacterium]|nr:hypothetical protein [Gemmataceae bacterium]